MSDQAAVRSSRLPAFFESRIGGLPRVYWVLWGGMLINRLGSLVMPMLTFYLTQKRGLPLANAGQVVALYGLGSLGGVLVGGVLADRLGRRTTLLFTLVVGAGSMLLLGAASSLVQLGLAALTLGFTADGARPAMLAAIADVVPVADRLRAFGLYYWAINLGFAFGSALAGLLAEVSFALVFAGDAATTLIFAFLVWRLLPETRPQAETSSGATGSWWAPFLDRTFAPFLLANFMVVLIVAQHQVTMPEALRADGLSMKDFGFLMSANGLTIVLVQPWVTPWLEPLRRGRVLLAASVLIGLGFGLGAFADSRLAWLLAVLVWTSGEILMTPVNASIVADLSPPALRGRYQGAHSISWSLAIMLAPLLGPRVAVAFGFDGLWFACLALGAVAGLLHLGLATLRRRQLEGHPVSGLD